MDVFDLKACILEKKLKAPTVFYQFHPISKWRFHLMTIDKLADILVEKKLKFRIGLRNPSSIQWEGQCHFVHATLKEFNRWLQSHHDCGDFQQFSKDHFWAYADYIYVKNLFEGITDLNMFDEIDWSKMGFSEGQGEDMAIWIGSKNSYTLCHYDTYGYNLVVQISGRKRWILFPPNETPFMYPTRIPYEESTVFSKVNLKNPDLTQHSKFSLSHPHVVELEPGDLLFVPPRWWHFVENLEDSISVNAWFPCENDPDERAKEALTRLLLGATVSCQSTASLATPLLPRVSSWINPTESSVHDFNENFNLLKKAFSLLNSESHSNPRQSEQFESENDLCTCSSSSSSPLSDVKCRYVNASCFRHACQLIKDWKLPSDLIGSKSIKRQRRDDNCDWLTVDKFVECLTSPRVITCLKHELEKSITNV